MAAILLYTVFFAAFGIPYLFDDPIDWTGALCFFSVSGLMIMMLVWIWSSHLRAHKTLQWLLDHENEISDDPIYFNDGPFFDKTICRETKMRSFKVVTSAFIITNVDELGMELRSGIWAGLFATAWTLVFGWWGLPWGPVRTIQALVHNCSGGKTISVAGAILSEKSGWNFETGERR